MGTENTIVTFSENNRRGHQGLRNEYAKLDEQVWIWYQKSTKEHQDVSKNDIQNYARTLYLKANLNNFKASDGWYRRWRNRWLKCGNLSKTKAELQSMDYDSIEALTLDLPDFDEHLFSIGRTDSLLELEDIEGIPTVQEPHLKKKHQENKIKSVAEDTASVLSKKMKICPKGQRYLPEFKQKVITYAANHSFSASAAHFKVHPTTVSSWIKKPKQPQKPSVMPENYFANWLELLQQKGERISKIDVQDQVDMIKEKFTHNDSKWFSLYYDRLHNNSCGPIQYPDIVKTEVVKLAKSWSQKYVSQILNISRKQIYNWLKDSSEEVSRSKKTRKTALKDNIDHDLWEWYSAQPLKPSIQEIQRKALEMFVDKGCNVTEISKNWFYKWCLKYGISSNSVLDIELLEWILKKFDQNSTPSLQLLRKKCALFHKKIHGKSKFKSSTGWVMRFCHRYPHYLQDIPGPKTVLPGKCEGNKQYFKENIKKIMSNNGVSLNQIGIMDESALRLSISSKCSKRLLRLCSFKNIEGTFVLSCTASGKILPLLLILKGPEIENQTLDDIVVVYQQNGFLDSTRMKFWIEKIWMEQIPEKSVLILDCFQPHVEASVEECFIQTNNYLAVIPPGSGSHFLFPLLEFSKHISEKVNQKWWNWLSNEGEGNTWDSMFKPVKSPSHSEIISWIRIAFVQLRKRYQALIKKDFQELLFDD